MNRLLPPAIRVLTAVEPAPAFHPRFDAVAKPPFEWRYVHHHPYRLDEARMIALAPLFVGERNFTAFAAADDRDAAGASKVRTIFHSKLERQGGRLIFRVRGSAFLKHMVRNMMGTLLEAGKGNVGEGSMFEKDGPTAPAKGCSW